MLRNTLVHVFVEDRYDAFKYSEDEPDYCPLIACIQYLQQFNR